MLFELASAYAARHDYAAVEQSYREAIQLGVQAPDVEYLTNAREFYARFLADQQRFQEAYTEIQLVVKAREQVEA